MQRGSLPLKVLALWLAALMVAATAAVVTIALVNQRVFGPEEQVRRYFSLLRAGEGGRALGLLRAEVPAGNALVLDGAGLAVAAAPVRGLEVLPAEPLTGDQVEVTARFTVDGRSHSTAFRLRHAGTEWLFFDRWAFAESELPVVTVHADTTNEIAVNGRPSPLASGAQRVPAFPGTVVEASYSSRYFEAPAKRVVVDSPAAAAEPVELVTRPTAELQDDVERRIRAYLDDCAQQQVLKPAACPLTYSTTARVDAGTIDWDIEEYPEVEVVPEGGRWSIAPMEASASIHLVEQDLMTGAFEEKTVEDTFGFTARLDAGPTSLSVTPVAGD